jgi:putative effector of murein hydrolase
MYRVCRVGCFVVYGFWIGLCNKEFLDVCFRYNGNAIGITEELKGIAAITIFAVILTGILGNAVGRQLCSFLGLKSPIARGLAIGNSSHAMGTAKAMEMGEKEGAASSLSIVISGLITAVIAPVILWIVL